MKMKKLNALLAVAGLALTLAPTAQAAPIFSADFEGSTAGAATSATLNAGTATGTWTVDNAGSGSVLGTDATPNTGAKFGKQVTGTYESHEH